MNGSRDFVDSPLHFGIPTVYEDSEMIPFTAALGPYYLAWRKILGRKTVHPGIEIDEHLPVGLAYRAKRKRQERPTKAQR